MSSNGLLAAGAAAGSAPAHTGISMSAKPAGSPVCLVTGITSGIGLATALGLARAGAHVILVGRDRDRVEAARQTIARETGSERLEVLLADLAVQADVRRLAEEVARRHERLDVLLNNAGAIRRSRELSPDGIEMTWAVNVLAPFLLTDLLSDVLRAGAPSRIVNVSSGAHLQATIDLGDLQFEHRRYRMMEAYGQSKLALTVLTNELAQRLAGTGITANSLHPGFIGSNFGSQIGPVVGALWRLVRPVLPSPEKGARTSIYLATSPEVAGVTGKYFDSCRPRDPNPLAENAEARRRLWDAAAAMTGLARAS